MKLSLLFFASLSLVISCIAQTPVSLPPVKDNSMYAELINNSNGVGANIYVGRNQANNNRRGLIKFDLSSIPPGSTINSASLVMFCNLLSGAGSVAENVVLHRALADWGEGTSSGAGQGAPASTGDATWHYRFFNTDTWTTDGGDFNSAATATTNVDAAGSYTWTDPLLLADVQNWINTPSSNFGWVITGNETLSRTAKGFISKDDPGGINLPVLNINYTSPVPVTLISFKAIENKSGVLLTWTTSQEFNNAFFSIEHSSDGIVFFSIRKVNGAGTSSLAHNYFFNHQGLLPGLHFYRLAQTDINGRINYSAVSQVNLKNNYGGLQLSPNPARDKLVLQGSAFANGNEFKIVDQKGQLVLRGIVDQKNIPLTQLASGIYCIVVTQADGAIISGRFLKL